MQGPLSVFAITIACVSCLATIVVLIGRYLRLVNATSTELNDFLHDKQAEEAVDSTL